MATEQPTKRFEIVGSSREGLEQAIEVAISRAGQTVRNLDWFEVKAIRGNIQGGKVGVYQVKLAVGFRALEMSELS